MWCTKWLVMVFTNRFQNGPKFGPNLSQFGPFLQISGQRHGPSTNSGFGQSLFADISPLQTFLHVNLGLPEFSQINGSNFLCFFNLPKIKNIVKNMWIQSFKCFVQKAHPCTYDYLDLSQFYSNSILIEILIKFVLSSILFIFWQNIFFS